MKRNRSLCVLPASPAGSGTSRRGGRVGVRHMAIVALLLSALVAALALMAGCGGNEPSKDGGYGSSTAGPMTETTYASATTTYAAPSRDQESGEAASSTPGYAGGTGVVLGTLSAGEHKVISNASLQIEVEEGKFQAIFDQASLLADKYGGYILSANSSATGQASIIRSGVVAIRIPAESLALALSDAGKLGKVTAQQLDSQDVTEEYVDLQARLKNAQAQEQAILLLLQRAETVEDALRVRETLMYIQQEIEQYKGRIAYLDEHSAFATLTMSVYEKGGMVIAGEGWGFVDALREAARALVRTINELIVFLGGALPVLVVLALIGWIVYLIVRAVLRRQRREREAAYAAQAQAQAAAYAAHGYYPAPAEVGPTVAAGTPAGTVSAAGASEAVPEAGDGAEDSNRA